MKNRGMNRRLRPGQEGSAEDTSGFDESVRTLRNSILLASFEQRYRSLLVTSAAPSEGKTTTAANLASAHAEQGLRTLLIDGDLRRPSVHRNFAIPSVKGLSNVLLGEMDWRDALQAIEDVPGLDVLPAGPPSRRGRRFCRLPKTFLDNVLRGDALRLGRFGLVHDIECGVRRRR